MTSLPGAKETPRRAAYDCIPWRSLYSRNFAFLVIMYSRNRSVRSASPKSSQGVIFTEACRSRRSCSWSPELRRNCWMWFNSNYFCALESPIIRQKIISHMFSRKVFDGARHRSHVCVCFLSSSLNSIAVLRISEISHCEHWLRRKWCPCVLKSRAIALARRWKVVHGIALHRTKCNFWAHQALKSRICRLPTDNMADGKNSSTGGGILG